MHWHRWRTRLSFPISSPSQEGQDERSREKLCYTVRVYWRTCQKCAERNPHCSGAACSFLGRKSMSPVGAHAAHANVAILTGTCARGPEPKTGASAFMISYHNLGTGDPPPYYTRRQGTRSHLQLHQWSVCALLIPEEAGLKVTTTELDSLKALRPSQGPRWLRSSGGGMRTNRPSAARLLTVSKFIPIAAHPHSTSDYIIPYGCLGQRSSP
jgi:hypothetical protein